MAGQKIKSKQLNYNTEGIKIQYFLCPVKLIGKIKEQKQKLKLIKNFLSKQSILNNFKTAKINSGYKLFFFRKSKES